MRSRKHRGRPDAQSARRCCRSGGQRFQRRMDTKRARASIRARALSGRVSVQAVAGVGSLSIGQSGDVGPAACMWLMWRRWGSIPAWDSGAGGAVHVGCEPGGSVAFRSWPVRCSRSLRPAPAGVDGRVAPTRVLHSLWLWQGRRVDGRGHREPLIGHGRFPRLHFRLPPSAAPSPDCGARSAC